MDTDFGILLITLLPALTAILKENYYVKNGKSRNLIKLPPENPLDLVNLLGYNYCWPYVVALVFDAFAVAVSDILFDYH